MLQVLNLLLPALIPSWRFFDTVAPSPRIEYALSADENTSIDNWQAFRPKPPSISFVQACWRMFHSPVRNEDLFLVSCAERLMADPTQHSENEIFDRIITEFRRTGGVPIQRPYLQFRLLLVSRVGDAVEVRECYVSPKRRVEQRAA